MRLDAHTVRSAAQGRWQSFILPALGIAVPPNPRKHGPCPFCGGKDRFRFDDQDGRGTWFCNRCDPQAGDGFALVMKIRRLEFHDALQLVASVLGLDSMAHAKAHRLLPPPPVCIDRWARAFKFELAALDLRLRSQQIVEAGKCLDIACLNDDALGQAFCHVAQAYADVTRAELFEGVADTLRTRDFSERKLREQHKRAA